ncbi:unnamed protein product [Acanthoscelides obtectus]|uniref:PHD-type domain-containing protein n=1 Tax=Acanthoscelides obtectus TaxID=200917 RepID=A0A9P0PI18_ACAOB|nr:unnamed protein product [Acanthoscelides obtectus]CAK1650659.1 hypothetical protein AOBTE_LOCUS16852 [Acanthoscelides obtectus]
MTLICLICETAVSRKQASIFCGGPCKKVVHVSCVYAGTVDLPTLIKQIPGLSWRCNDCLSSDVSIEDTDLGQLVESKISHALDSIVVQINELKSTIEQAILQNPDASSVNKPISYASVLRNKTVPAVIIKPKESQDTSKTKTDILQNVNLVADEIHISKIKHVNDGGVLIGCKSAEGNLKLKKLVQEKMVGSYDVKDVGCVNPRVRIIGMTLEYSAEHLRNQLFNMNDVLISNPNDSKIIKILPFKRDNAKYQAVV